MISHEHGERGVSHRSVRIVAYCRVTPNDLFESPKTAYGLGKSVEPRADRRFCGLIGSRDARDGLLDQIQLLLEPQMGEPNTEYLKEGNIYEFLAIGFAAQRRIIAI